MSYVRSPPSSCTLFIDEYLARLWCAFTTESMAVAYANSETLTPKVCKSIFYEFGSIKNGARGRFYVVLKYHKSQLRRTLPLFISLLYPSTGRAIEVKIGSVAGN